MQVSEFEGGGFVVHKLYLDGMESKFSIWVNRFGMLTDAARYDKAGREYDVNRNSMTWARLDGRSQVIAADMQRRKNAIGELQARRNARGMSDPLNRLRAYCATQTPIVAKES